VMEFREPNDCALLVDRTLTAADAIHQLSYGSPDGSPANALILTENKLPTDRPMRVIAVYDVPLLSASLKSANGTQREAFPNSRSPRRATLNPQRSGWVGLWLASVPRLKSHRLVLLV
jgi:hypothetical protein